MHVNEAVLWRGLEGVDDMEGMFWPFFHFTCWEKSAQSEKEMLLESVELLGLKTFFGLWLGKALHRAIS